MHWYVTCIFERESDWINCMNATKIGEVNNNSGDDDDYLIKCIVSACKEKACTMYMETERGLPAEQYLLTALRYKCEYYVCWKVQASNITLHTILSIMAVADSHSFDSLKQACLEATFLHGQHLFQDYTSMTELQQKIAVEMLVYFANRRTTAAICGETCASMRKK